MYGGASTPTKTERRGYKLSQKEEGEAAQHLHKQSGRLHCPKKRRVRLPIWRNIITCTNRVISVTLSQKEEGEAARLEEHQHLHKQSGGGYTVP